MLLSRLLFKFCPKTKGIPGTLIRVYNSDLFKNFKMTGHKRNYTEKGKEPKKPAKEPVDEMKIPGLVHPEAANEEGYFAEKNKAQADELKKKTGKPTNPDKKE